MIQAQQDKGKAARGRYELGELPSGMLEMESARKNNPVHLSMLGPCAQLGEYFFFLAEVFGEVYILSGEGNGKPLQYSCLENTTDGGA